MKATPGSLESPLGRFLLELQSAPDQECPDCPIESALAYIDSDSGEDGGRSFQYDYYSCPRCHGHFQYSHQDRKLKKLGGL
jgi:hypothetical protein